jgi:hypothetical protein
MKITSIGDNITPPKNYSRKGTICSCRTLIIYQEKGELIIIERVMVKYEVEPNKDTIPLIKLKRGQWANYQHWGEFKRVIELPKEFDKLDYEDFVVKTGFFKRDGIQTPFIAEIKILNVPKYKLLKQKESRKEKLCKINNS